MSDILGGPREVRDVGVQELPSRVERLYTANIRLEANFKGLETEIGSKKNQSTKIRERANADIATMKAEIAGLENAKHMATSVAVLYIHDSSA